MESPATSLRQPRARLTMAMFIILVVGVGGAIGFLSAPTAWYQELIKPPFNPPNWLFAPAWLILYILIGIAGARTFLRDASSPATAIWAIQMVLNWAWSPTFFRLHLIWPAGVLIVVILALILAFIAVSWRRDRVSAWLFVPYAAWVAFASLLNISIGVLN
jgi:benzodiazapine receptor